MDKILNIEIGKKGGNYYNPLDGAFVDAHPAHVSMGISKYRPLRNFLNQTNSFNDNKGYCKKIKFFYNN